ncbi:MAG: BrxA/BrxB family bacilliredoxin [Bryobacterales bacterium]|nr:BrxA/BrxB family bacilliredoxin [Bryobacterales bacterium]MBV9396986.1 BrxA/BrxB family bacilliredoxin [Bryobacterales bacterium]
MPYPEPFIAPMRADLTRYGVEEARTPADVDRLIAPENGTVMMIVNSVCGCAAGKARPAVGMALEHPLRPAKVGTVFAGADEQAVARLRAILSQYPPSSPSIALFRDGQPIHMIHRRDIEVRDAFAVAELLKEAFEKYYQPSLTPGGRT